jgi:hypothetical protein
MPGRSVSGAVRAWAHVPGQFRSGGPWRGGRPHGRRLAGRSGLSQASRAGGCQAGGGRVRPSVRRVPDLRGQGRPSGLRVSGRRPSAGLSGSACQTGAGRGHAFRAPRVRAERAVAGIPGSACQGRHSGIRVSGRSGPWQAFRPPRVRPSGLRVSGLPASACQAGAGRGRPSGLRVSCRSGPGHAFRAPRVGPEWAGGMASGLLVSGRSGPATLVAFAYLFTDESM